MPSRRPEGPVRRKYWGQGYPKIIKPFKILDFEAKTPHNIYSRNPVALQQKTTPAAAGGPCRAEIVKNEWSFVAIRRDKKTDPRQIQQKNPLAESAFRSRGRNQTQKCTNAFFLCYNNPNRRRCRERRRVGGRRRCKEPGGISDERGTNDDETC